MADQREYWLDGYNGPCQSGTFYRSKIHLEIEEFETKFKTKVVAIKLSPDYESGKASWTVEFIREGTKEQFEEYIKQYHPETLKTLATGTDEIHEAEEADED